jgi:hypothetical protein
MYRTMIRFALGLLTLLTLAACGMAAQPTAQIVTTPVASPAPDNAVRPKIGVHATLVTIRSEGGNCMNGGCWSEQQIKADGSFTTADNTGAKRSGTLDTAAVAQLTQQIAATDFEQVKAKPFTGTCPVAFDGQEHIYTFQTLSGPQTIASCKVAIDENSPLFQTIAGLSAAMKQE